MIWCARFISKELGCDIWSPKEDRKNGKQNDVASLKQKVDTSASTQGNEKAIISSLHMSMPHLMNYTAAITHWETPRKAGTGWACVSALSPSLLSLSAWGFGYSPLGSPHFHCACSARRLPVTQHCQRMQACQRQPWALWLQRRCKKQCS